MAEPTLAERVQALEERKIEVADLPLQPLIRKIELLGLDPSVISNGVSTVNMIAATPMDDLGMTTIPTTTYNTILQTLTVPTDGLYRVEYGVQLQAVAGVTTSYACLFVNGSSVANFQRAGQFGGQASFVAVAPRTQLAGDVLTLRVRVDAVTANARYGGNYLSIRSS